MEDNIKIKTSKLKNLFEIFCQIGDKSNKFSIYENDDNSEVNLNNFFYK